MILIRSERELISRFFNVKTEKLIDEKVKFVLELENKPYCFAFYTNNDFFYHNDINNSKFLDRNNRNVCKGLFAWLNVFRYHKAYRLVYAVFGFKNSPVIKYDLFIQKNDIFYDPELMTVISDNFNMTNSIISFQNEYGEPLPIGVSNLDDNLIIFKSKEEAVKHIREVYDSRTKKSIAILDKKFKGMV